MANDEDIEKGSKYLALAKNVVALLVVVAAATTSAVFALDSRHQPKGEYVTASEFQSVSIEVLYNSFWSTMDHLQEARQQGDATREKQMLRNAQRLLAKICAVEPTFEYCDTGIPN